MPVVIVHTKAQWHLTDNDVVTATSLPEAKLYTHLLLDALPQIVVDAHGALGIGGFEPEVVVVIPKLMPMHSRNAPDVWINLQTGRPEFATPTIEELRIETLNRVTGWAWGERTAIFDARPTIDLDCEFRDWSGVSLDRDGALLGEW
jgi:hypothetical protein